MTKKLLIVLASILLVFVTLNGCSKKQRLSPEDQAMLDKAVATLEAQKKTLEKKNAALAAEIKAAKEAAAKPNATLAEKAKALELQKEQLETAKALKETETQVKETTKTRNSGKSSSGKDKTSTSSKMAKSTTDTAATKSNSTSKTGTATKEITKQEQEKLEAQLAATAQASAAQLQKAEQQAAAAQQAAQDAAAETSLTKLEKTATDSSGWVNEPYIVKYSTPAERALWLKEYNDLLSKETGKAAAKGGGKSLEASYYTMDVLDLIKKRDKETNEPKWLAAWKAAADKAPFSWTAQKMKLPNAQNTSMITYSPDITKIAYSVGHDMYYSTNGGTTWTTVKPTPYDGMDGGIYGFGLRDLVYANGIFAAQASWQGRNPNPRWIAHMSPGGTPLIDVVPRLAYGWIDSIVSNGDRFLLVGGSGMKSTVDYIAWSTDCKTWTQVPASALGGKDATEYYNVYGTEVPLDGDGTCFASRFSGWTSTFVGGGKFWGYRNDYKLFFSSDAVTWTASVTPSGKGQTIRQVTYGNGKYAATSSGVSRSGVFDGVSDFGVVYSSDGINWKGVKLPDGIYIDTVTFGGGYFLATGRRDTEGVEPNTAWFYSSDAITWNVVPGGLDSYYGMEPKNFVYDGSRFIANFFASHYTTHPNREFDDTWAYSKKR